MSNLKIAALQAVQFWEDKEKNLSHFEGLLSSVSKGEIDILVFPEMFHTGFSMRPEKLYEEMHHSLGIDYLLSKSKQFSCLCIGTLIIKENNQFFNRMIAAFPDGKIEYYDKRYLFSFAGEDNVYSAGTSQKIIQYKSWNILLQICFDLRFPEASRNCLLEKGEAKYDFVIYSANWPQKRIQHWEALLKARAIENQAFVLGVNRVGEDGNKHLYNGKTQLIDPFGECLALCMDNQEEILFSEISSAKIQDIRINMNFLKDQK